MFFLIFLKVAAEVISELSLTAVNKVEEVFNLSQVKICSLKKIKTQLYDQKKIRSIIKKKLSPKKNILIIPISTQCNTKQEMCYQ